jgi:hypothetical protein
MLPEIIYLSRNGQMLGSFHRDAIKTGLENRTYFPDDLAWYEGASGWAPLHTLEGLGTPLPAPPAATSSQPEPPIPPAIPPATAPPIPRQTPAPPTAPSITPPIPPRSSNRGCACLLLSLLLLLLLLGGGVIAAYKFGLWEKLTRQVKTPDSHPNSTKRESSNDSARSVREPTPSPGDLQATNFYPWAKRDPEAARGAFNDQFVNMFGVVDTAGVNAFGQPFVLLKAGGADYLTCLFPVTAKSAVTSLREGQSVRLRGQCTGIGSSSFCLQKCTLVQ